MSSSISCSIFCVGSSSVGFSVVVPSAPLPSPTTIVPCISGCSSQWYGTVPSPSKTTGYEDPGGISKSNSLVSEVAVCGTLSLLTNVTVVPGATLSWGGLKALLRISTVVVLSGAGVVLSAGASAGTVVDFCTSVVFWFGSWPAGVATGVL